MKILEFLNSIENKTNRLVEERGLAAIPHREIVDKILRFCQRKSSSLKNGQSITFIVPPIVVKSIDIVKRLEIEVTITDATSDKSLNGSGKVELGDVVGWENNKIDYAKITIKGFSYNGVLFDRTILSSLYHELNHLYDFWQDLSKSGNLNRSGKTLQKAGDRKRCEITLNKTTNDLIHEIVYRLFSETEFNALVANTYGELQGMNSVRQNFKNDIQKTKPYIIYNGLKNRLSSIRNSILKVPNGIQNLKQYLEENGIFLTPYDNSDNAYLKEFFRKTTYLLKRLYKKIGKTASLYYDTVEFNYPSNNKISTKWS